MMSLVKNCSVFLFCTLLLMAAGCKKEDTNAPEQSQPEQQRPQPEPQPSETFAGNVERPTWSVPADYDVTSSMTAVVKVDLKAQYPDKAADFVLDDNDILAAFSGETCLGTASPQDDLFYLFIAGPVTGNPSSITLRYFSAHYKNLFEAKDAFSFVNDDHLGTVAEPLIPPFVLAAK